MRVRRREKLTLALIFYIEVDQRKILKLACIILKVIVDKGSDVSTPEFFLLLILLVYHEGF